mgnify:CR=1 FL=1
MECITRTIPAIHAFIGCCPQHAILGDQQIGNAAQSQIERIIAWQGHMFDTALRRIDQVDAATKAAD